MDGLVAGGEDEHLGVNPGVCVTGSKTYARVDAWRSECFIREIFNFLKMIGSVRLVKSHLSAFKYQSVSIKN